MKRCYSSAFQIAGEKKGQALGGPPIDFCLLYAVPVFYLTRIIFLTAL
jgi:hypothetical protein